MSKTPLEELKPLFKEIQIQLFGKFKLYSYIILALVILSISYYSYQNYYLEPLNNEASLELSYSQDFYAKDSLDLALKGSLSSKGFFKIVEEYGNTDYGNLANFYVGSIYLKKKNFKEAITFLDAYSAPNDFMLSRKLGLLGDAYSEVNDVENAIKHYYQSYETAPKDKYWAAEALYKGGTFALINDNIELAKKCFVPLANEYPNYKNHQQTKNYLASIGVFESMGKYE